VGTAAGACSAVAPPPAARRGGREVIDRPVGPCARHAPPASDGERGEPRLPACAVHSVLWRPRSPWPVRCRCGHGDSSRYPACWTDIHLYC
jgi:hypothetical protein